MATLHQLFTRNQDTLKLLLACATKDDHIILLDEGALLAIECIDWPCKVSVLQHSVNLWQIDDQLIDTIKPVNQVNWVTLTTEFTSTSWT